MQDTIERSIDISAPLDRVWELVTQPGWWVPTDVPVTADRRPGEVVVRESERWGPFPVEVVRLDPPTYAAFRWSSAFPGGDLVPGRTTTVEFTLAPNEAGVRVSVIESGFGSLDAPDALRETTLGTNSDGWTQELASLQQRSESETADR